MTSLGHPIPFRAFLAEKGPKNLKRGFLAEKGQQNPETDWDDKPGKPRLVISVRLEIFGPKRAKKTRNGLG